MQDKIHRGWRGGGGGRRGGGQGLEMCLVVAVLVSACGLVEGSEMDACFHGCRRIDHRRRG